MPRWMMLGYSAKAELLKGLYRGVNLMKTEYSIECENCHSFNLQEGIITKGKVYCSDCWKKKQGKPKATKQITKQPKERNKMGGLGFDMPSFDMPAWANNMKGMAPNKMPKWNSFKGMGK